MTGRPRPVGFPAHAGRRSSSGSVNADLVVRAARLPGPGETVTGGTFARHGGGKGANQAVAAARLGARTALVAAGAATTSAREALRGLPPRARRRRRRAPG